MEIASTLRLFETKKVAVFSKPKVATRLLDRIKFDNSFAGIDINWNGEIIIPNGSMFKEDDISSIGVFSKNKNKKDIILLYRDPFERFITGFAQSTIILYLSTPIALSLAMPTLSKFKNNIPSIIYGCNCIINNEAISPEKTSSSDTLFDEASELLDSLTKNIVTMLSYINIPYDIHTDNYLMIYNSLINNKFDSNKVTLVNVDNNENILSDILSNYVTIEESSTKNTNNFLKQIFKKHLQTNKTTSDKIQKYIEMDYYFYNQFETSPLNILNKK